MNDTTPLPAAPHQPPNRSSNDVRLSKNWWSRRTRFQLTPLMDLLLIIVFAQFLDVREVSKQQTASLQSEREKLTFQIARERSELTGIREALQSQRKLLEKQRDEARAARDEAVNQTQSRLAEMEFAMQKISRWFSLDEQAIADVESQLVPNPSEETTVDPVSSAIAQASRLGQADPNAVIRFLIGHAELLKRAEIWTIHAADNGSINMLAGERRESFRLESRSQSARTSEVADRLFAAYKQLPQPKGLVILLVSYAPQSVAGVYQPLVDAMPQALERLRADTPETRFEYTVLGTTPDPN
ncbi:hypothetical protein [Aporhodopirellula aestuarii]|uniref:Uncharacterized protein n=1 Tax=Aporhodopirellula aestuarii TaxID=2950107 RepID=A0ABT0TWM7_9BACT|nr:hypothetical protein [Aporhodopirellula aestuarii]MCM2369032.1 hypothetical protein [Aporhodopirellula aestuarii]